MLPNGRLLQFASNEFKVSAESASDGLSGIVHAQRSGWLKIFAGRNHSPPQFVYWAECADNAYLGAAGVPYHESDGMALPPVFAVRTGS
jgi:hypothetical protein